MIQRIKQFYRALSASITAEDWHFVEEKLPPAAVTLFKAMHPADQYHALHVTKTAMTLSAAQPQPSGDRELLIRAALLHDVGRVKGDMDIWGKVWAVLLHRFCPCWSKRKAQTESVARRNYLSHILYVYYHHPDIGAAKVHAVGLVREAEIIRQHHKAPQDSDSWELRLLRQADAMN